MTPQTAALDGLRAIALLMVLLFHVVFITGMRFASSLALLRGDRSGAPPAQVRVMTDWLRSWPTQPTAAGDMGVDIFFVLSG